MVKQIKCDDPQLKDQVQQLLNFHLGSIDELVDKLEMSVLHTEKRGDEPLYLCRVGWLSRIPAPAGWLLRSVRQTSP
ncbi:MAG: hypothetical protein KME48_02660 [Candidatus Thiodiazotropha sp. (ex Ctena orbiculata)]|uniref:Uncharacterized protein n=1 Tax=Candidatus Thiodiazotropha taylori TaxID=2792791 RepID=A0A944M6L5_9GAMM|nr:hypothetical protein [Candidatus Thiodiazotropha taylori]MBT3026046.1 hypothetical protein [Candidatus Thiodiazotropha taylori]MBT3033481.1 hypothetical protein [Candidatus Thiodiazotropha taylori]MBV2135858.1 hypothetical protein [Candidatus Thiodiazotropha taylori]